MSFRDEVPSDPQAQVGRGRQQCRVGGFARQWQIGARRVGG
jgi:hypothetical protein